MKKLGERLGWLLLILIILVMVEAPRKMKHSQNWGRFALVSSAVIFVGLITYVGLTR